MDSEDKDKQPQNMNPNKPPAPGAPGSLPIVEQKTFLTHTMEEDVQKARGQGYVPEKPEAKKPFAQPIAPPIPPSSPNPSNPLSSQNDPFREVLDDRMLERDQPFPLDANMPAGSTTEKKFQIYVPHKKRTGIATIVLSFILLLLLGGGGFAYYWFFMKTPAQVVEPTPPVTPEPVIAQPVAPEQQPAPELTPELAPPEQPIVIIEPVVVPEPATSTPPVVTTPPPVEPPAQVVIPEPAVPASLIAVDRTVIIDIATLNNADIFTKIALENVKIAEDKVAVRYLFKLSTGAEKRFLTQKETAELLSLAVPLGYWDQSAMLEFIGYKNMGSFRYGFVSSISNKTAMQKVASAWEATMIKNLKSLYVEKPYVKPVGAKFSSNAYLDFTKRYINLPAPDVSLDWALSAKYFIVATSKDMIFALLDKAQQMNSGTASSSPAVPSY